MNAGRMKIGIIGAGFTGTMLAANLLRRCRSPLDILLFDRAGAFGRGTAYSTTNARHLLNVRVGSMSAYDDDPQHFRRWLDGSAGDHAFAPRERYGAYLQETIKGERQRRDDCSVRHVAAEVTGLAMRDGAITLGLSDGTSHDVATAALCVGNFPPVSPVPAAMLEPARARYIADPWRGQGIGSIGRSDPVVLIGAGLTMADTVLDLESRGHVGRITALSRHGLLHEAHADAPPYAPFLNPDDLPRRALDLLRAVRGEVRKAAASGVGWRSVVDSLRPQTQALWRALPMAEQRRFMRHARPYWEICRHRLAPEVAADLRSLESQGRFEVMAGRIVSLERAGDVLRLGVRRRHRAEVETVSAAWLINCSGPELDYGRIHDPFIQLLFKAGLARPDPMALGLDVTPEFQLIAADGTASTSLFAIGPPIRGILWETTAVPDIRKQCSALAQQIADGQAG
jgi:uncharacterized NAD(P)/FAD-binding protein YdhS